MSEAKLKLGDVVRLKTGGPLMTITKSEEQAALALAEAP